MKVTNNTIVIPRVGKKWPMFASNPGGGSPPPPSFTNLHSGSFTAASLMYVDYGNVADEDGTHTFSISAWVKPGTGSFLEIMSKGDYTSPGTGWNFLLRNDGNSQRLQFLTGGGSFRVSPNNSAPAYDGNWHHVVGTFTDSSHYGLYFDGALIASGTNTAGTGWSSGNTSNLQIGGISIGGFGNTYYNGLLDEVSKWPIALTDANVTELYNAGHPSDITQLSFYGSSGFASSNRAVWVRFENSWNDVSPNAYTATTHNSPTFSTDVA